MQQSMIHGKYHGKPVTYLVMFTCDLGNHRNGIPFGRCAYNATSRVTVDDIMGKSHKMIAQGKMMSSPRMEMTNDTFRCSRAAQVHMEDLRLVSLTEYHPSRRGE